MGFAWQCALKDVRRQLRDPLTLVVWCGIPLLVAGLMSLAIGGGDGPRALVLVADEDETFVSEFLGGALSQATDMFLVESVTRDVGLERMDDGDASVLLMIPAGFGEAVFRDEPTTLELVTNPSQSIVPPMIENMLEILVRGTFYVQQLMGDTLRTMADGPEEGARTFPSLTVAAMSVEINDVVTRVVEVLDPPLVELETTVESTEGGGFDFGTVLFPGLLFMALLFVAQGMSEDIWKEREQGTLRRVVSSPRGTATLLGGKLLAGGVFAGGVTLLGMSAGVLLFDIDPVRIPLALLWASVAGAGLMAMFVLLQMFGSTRRGASMLTNMVLFPLMFMGGSFFPFEQMPGWMAEVGRHTPNGWALTGMRSLLSGTMESGAMASGLALMLAVGAVLFVLSARRMRRGFALGGA